MVKRLFWIGVGIAVGVVAVSKAQSYVKANTPKTAREFILGPDQTNVAARTLNGLFQEFQQARIQRESELNARYAERFRA
ncbi:MAG: hypothetical protein ABF747_04555 [Bifidobacterium sp.]|uniref:Secreted protein n=1 Tax=Bifidobacterium fermentum TaxID=3059035 RepID=A0AB39UQA2_9BIFI